jgi:hypothetical protein
MYLKVCILLLCLYKQEKISDPQNGADKDSSLWSDVGWYITNTFEDLSAPIFRVDHKKSTVYSEAKMDQWLQT